MLRRYLPIFSFVAALLFFVGSLSWFFWCKVQPTILCDRPVFDAGTVPKGADVTCDFTLRNNGYLSLRIYEVRPSCSSCISIISYPKQPIQPGRTGVIALRISTKFLKGHSEKTIAVHSNDRNKPWYFLRVRASIGT